MKNLRENLRKFTASGLSKIRGLEGVQPHCADSYIGGALLRNAKEKLDFGVVPNGAAPVKRVDDERGPIS